MKRTLVTLLLVGVLLPATSRCQPPSLLAVWGSTGDQPGQFNHPTGVALGPDGNVYVADIANHRIQVLTSGGAFATQWGSHGFDPWSLTAPIHVAVDANDHVFVTEWNISDNSQTGLQVFTTTGTYLTSWGPLGDSTLAFGSPFGVAVGPDGRVYVADGGDRVYVFASDGAYITYWPVVARGLAVDAFGYAYVMDTQCPCLRKFTTSGTEVTSWASGGLDVAADAHGNVYVADMSSNRVQVFTSNGVFVTEWGSYGSDPGQFNRPMGIAVGADGRVYVADTYNDRIQVFGPIPTPVKTTSWGQLKSLYR